MNKSIFAAVGMLLASAAHADATATGQAIAEALNKRDVEAMMRQLDMESIVRLVTKDLGLGQGDREQVRRGLPTGLRSNINLSMKTIEAGKGGARYLRNGTRDGKPFALVRYDLGDQGIDYVEYYVTSTSKVEDWYVHSVATLYSASARFDLATMLKTDSMLFTVFGSKVATKADLKPFTDLRTHLNNQDFAKAFKTLDEFPDGYKKSRQWALMRVTYGGRVDEQTHRNALRELAKNFGADPELQFMLVDHYFFEQQFDRAMGAIGALERSIGGEDAATMNLRGNVLLAAKRYDDAQKACRRGMQLESDHKPAYWCLVAVGLGQNNGKIAVEGLKAYEKAFEVVFNLDQLAAQAEYKQISATPEFAAWRKSRR
jgi:tetratricopeptide (TPR) repeat protein